jgi:hypothetical protein
MALPSPTHFLSDNARWMYPLGVVLLSAILGHFFGLGMGLLVMAGGTLGGSIWLIWSSLQGLGGDVPITLEEALSLGAPSSEEEQKRAVLRALKDLEYERAVGKISEEDYASLAEHYRSEAKRLLRAVDMDLSPERERAERILAERLAAANGKARVTADEAKAAKAKAKASAGAKAEATTTAEATPATATDADLATPGGDADVDPAPAAKSPPSDTAP